MRGDPDSKPTRIHLNPAAVHRGGLRVGEELGLDEAAQPPVDAEPFLRFADRIHQLHHPRIHVQLVVVEHEPADAVALVQADHLVDDVLGRARAYFPEHRRGTAAAESALERAAQLGDQAERAAPVDGVVVTVDVDQVPRRIGQRVELGVGEKERRAHVVGVDQLRPAGLERLEDRLFAVAGDEHVEGGGENVERVSGAAGGAAPCAALCLFLHRGRDERDVRPSEDHGRVRADRMNRLRDLGGRRHLRGGRRDPEMRGWRGGHVHPDDVDEVVHAREIEHFHGDARLLEHGGEPEDPQAHEHALVEQKARGRDDQTDFIHRSQLRTISCSAGLYPDYS